MSGEFEISERDLKRFNWGAFLFGVIWGLFNKTPITLIQIPVALIPIVGALLNIESIPVIGTILNLLLLIWFGIMGNRWAYKNQKFTDVNDFNNYQRRFVKIWLLFTGYKIVSNIALINLESIPMVYARWFPFLLLIGLTAILLFSLWYLLRASKKTKVITLTSLCAVILLSFMLYAGNLMLKVSMFNSISAGDFNNVARIARFYGDISFKKSQKIYCYNQAGMAYIETKNLKDAILCFEKAQKIAKSSKSEILPVFDDRLTDLYIITGDMEKAKSLNHGFKVYIYENDWENAINELEKYNMGINDFDIAAAKAVVYKNLGENEKALLNYNQAISMLPDNSEGKKNIENGFKNYKTYYRDYFATLKKELQ